MKTVFFLSLSLTAFSVLAGEIRNVTVRQRWPWSRKVDIHFELIANPGEMDGIDVTLYNNGQKLDTSDTEFTGLSGVGDGSHTVTWDPTASIYANQGIMHSFRAEVTCRELPLYMIVDLTKNSSDEGQISYLFRTNLVSGAYGTVETNFWGSDAAPGVIWTGVTNDTVYATTKMVFRFIPGGVFMMGDTGLVDSSGRGKVSLTEGYWMAVFETTQDQWKNVTGSASHSLFTIDGSRRPVENHSMNGIHGGGTGYIYPTDGSAVEESSFIGMLRSKTGNRILFNLPTEAQWEWACHAGTTTPYYDGDTTVAITPDTATALYNNNCNRLARYTFTGGKLPPDYTELAPISSSPENGTAIVGTYLPNAWGLYDMLGNVSELVLTRGASPSFGTDPTGDGSSEQVWKGGCWYNSAQYCRSGYRRTLATYNNYTYDYSRGFRMWAPYSPITE